MNSTKKFMNVLFNSIKLHYKDVSCSDIGNLCKEIKFSDHIIYIDNDNKLDYSDIKESSIQFVIRPYIRLPINYELTDYESLENDFKERIKNLIENNIYVCSWIDDDNNHHRLTYYTGLFTQSFDKYINKHTTSKLRNYLISEMEKEIILLI